MLEQPQWRTGLNPEAMTYPRLPKQRANTRSQWDRTPPRCSMHDEDEEEGVRSWALPPTVHSSDCTGVRELRDCGWPTRSTLCSLLPCWASQSTVAKDPADGIFLSRVKDYPMRGSPSSFCTGDQDHVHLVSCDHFVGVSRRQFSGMSDTSMTCWPQSVASGPTLVFHLSFLVRILVCQMLGVAQKLTCETMREHLEVK